MGILPVLFLKKAAHAEIFTHSSSMAADSFHSGCRCIGNHSFKLPHVFALEKPRNVWRSSLGSSGICSVEEQAESEQPLYFVLRDDHGHVSWGCGRPDH